MKVATAKLNDGIAFADADRTRLLPITDVFESFTLTLMQAVGHVESITVRPMSVQDAIDVEAEVLNNHRHGTPGFNEAVFRAHLKRRATPDITPKMLDQMAGSDNDVLRALVAYGIAPGGKSAHTRKPEVTVEQNAVVRLHFMSDRKLMEQRMPSTRAENPMLYEAYLTWWLTRFGDPADADFDKPPIEFHEFARMSFFDLTALNAVVLGRDYKDLIDVLGGDAEVDGKPVPFQGVPSDELEEPS